MVLLGLLGAFGLLVRQVGMLQGDSAGVGAWGLLAPNGIVAQAVGLAVCCWWCECWCSLGMSLRADAMLVVQLLVLARTAERALRNER